MKNKKVFRKLSLKKLTISHLNPDEMFKIKGAADDIPIIFTRCRSCPGNKTCYC